MHQSDKETFNDFIEYSYTEESIIKNKKAILLRSYCEGIWNHQQKKIDELEAANSRLFSDNADLEAKFAKALEAINGAYDYLVATYDLPSWKDEPEYAMMKKFEETLEEIGKQNDK